MQRLEPHNLVSENNMLFRTVWVQSPGSIPGQHDLASNLATYNFAAFLAFKEHILPLLKAFNSLSLITYLMLNSMALFLWHDF